MKKFIVTLITTILGSLPFYLAISFVTLTPTVDGWGWIGRAIFAIILLLIFFTTYEETGKATKDSSNDN